ncbi:hypothetical protein WJX75_009235 [Coccomyxa subellipsoidea]|uniref:Uncharacterized protein n=1 Tax=Coccomyxa subellipsoidea TaxID=248742 RepID=A0ABR2YS50_9CHLO
MTPEFPHWGGPQSEGPSNQSTLQLLLLCAVTAGTVSVTGTQTVAKGTSDVTSFGKLAVGSIFNETVQLYEGAVESITEAYAQVKVNDSPAREHNSSSNTKHPTNNRREHNSSSNTKHPTNNRSDGHIDAGYDPFHHTNPHPYYPATRIGKTVCDIQF